MSSRYGLHGVTTAVRTIAKRVFGTAAAQKKQDMLKQVGKGNAYYVIWGSDGWQYDGDAYFPTREDALRFWEDTEGLPYADYWHRVPMFFGISAKKFVDLTTYSCEQVDTELCSGPWAAWKKKYGSTTRGPAYLTQDATAGRAIRKRARVIREAQRDTDTLNEVQGGGYQVVWHEFVAGRVAVREMYFPTLALAKKFWADRPRGENYQEWFAKYEGINPMWYGMWATKGCGGDAAWVCAGSWGKLKSAGSTQLGFFGAAPTDVRRIQALWMTTFGYDAVTGQRVSERDITVLSSGKFYVRGHGAVLVLTADEAARLRLKSRLGGAERVAAQQPYHPEMYVFKA